MLAPVIPIRPSANPHERFNRIQKALKIADVLDKFQFSSEQAGTFTPQQWGMAARGAQVNPPSAETQAAVISMLEARERVKEMVKGGRG
jgi:hypothetical protein